MSWMILPCLFVYLFVGVVLVAWLEERGWDTGKSTVLVAVLWPLALLALAESAFGLLIKYLIKKVRSYL